MLLAVPIDRHRFAYPVQGVSGQLSAAPAGFWRFRSGLMGPQKTGVSVCLVAESDSPFCCK
jgi:hypothetical protein